MNTRFLDVRDVTSEKTEQALKEAAAVIRCGGLVAFPTETVYGLGADGTKNESAKAIFSAKGRPADNPLILHIAKPVDAEKYAYTSPLFYKLAETFMPGPLTVVLPAKESVPKSVTASLPTVALRIPIHPIARRLIELSDTAIAAPSANVSGRPSPTCASDVKVDMEHKIDMILDGGECSVGVESTIVKIIDENDVVLLRPGAITIEDLEAQGIKVTVAQAVTAALKEGETVESPGMKYRHYAPSVPLVLLKGNNKSRQNYLSKINETYAVICYTEELTTYQHLLGENKVYDLGSENDPKTHASRLFALLRRADQNIFDRIYAPLPHTDGIGLALYNRMIRAAAHQIIDTEEF